MTNRFVGRVQVQAHVLFDSIEKLLAARQDDLCGLSIIENAQHHPGQRKQQGEHHADMDMQGKATWIRAQWVGHAGLSMMVNTLLSVQA
ncbi:hypothetical protein D9M73_268240 [compost metagenome]